MRRFIADEDASGLQPAVVEKVRAHGLLPPGYGARGRAAEGSRAGRRTSSPATARGVWSLFVTKNWRMTFRIDQDEIEIIDLDYEDYH